MRTLRSRPGQACRFVPGLPAVAAIVMQSIRTWTLVKSQLASVNVAIVRLGWTRLKLDIFRDRAGGYVHALFGCGACWKRTMTGSAESMISTLSLREQVRSAYSKHRDPIFDDRMLWRAQSFRHIMHLLPGHRILELGCGDGVFTRQLINTTRHECAITAVTFDSNASRPASLPEDVEFISLSAFPGQLEDRKFDFVVAHDMLDKRSGSWLLDRIYNLLEPGGQVLFYESNPWNVVLKLRRAVGYLAGHKDPRLLLSRAELYELLSEVGYIRVFAIFNDYAYAPLSRRLVWIFRNLSIVLENTPGVRTLAGTIILHGQKPPRPITNLACLTGHTRTAPMRCFYCGAVS